MTDWMLIGPILIGLAIGVQLLELWRILRHDRNMRQHEKDDT